MGIFSSIFGGSEDASSTSTSSNTTSNNTSTSNSLKNMTTDGGSIAITGESAANTRVNSNSNNSLYSDTHDTTFNYLTNTDFGAVQAGAALGARALELASSSVDHLTSASAVLNRSALDMLTHSDNLAATLAGNSNSLATTLTAGSNSLANSLFSGVMGLMDTTLKNNQQTVQIASTLAQAPTKAQDPNRYLIAGGLAMVAIVAFMALKGK